MGQGTHVVINLSSVLHYLHSQYKGNWRGTGWEHAFFCNNYC